MTAALFSPPALAQGSFTRGPAIGSVDGEPIAPFVVQPEDLPAKCQNLKANISTLIYDAQKRRFGIFVSSEEAKIAGLKELEVNWLRMKQDLEKQRERSRVLLAAAAEVHDHGRDPEEVYLRLVAPALNRSDASRHFWDRLLEQARTPKGRAAIAGQINVTDEAARQGFLSSAPVMLEKIKMDDAVDGELSRDGLFREYLEELKSKTHWRSPLSPEVRRMDGNHLDYLTAKRLEWWRERHAEARVVLNDSSLFDTCGLAKIGVRSPGKAMRQNRP